MEPRGPSFLHRLREIERTLEWANDSLTMSTEAQHAFALSAEWLLDNAYLIREQATELRRSLPRESYGELPVIASGPQSGTPARLPDRGGDRGRERRRGRSGDDSEISRRLPGGCAARHRGTLGGAADVAVASGRKSAPAGDPGRATPGRERRGGLLGESSDHGGAAQFVASARDDGATGGRHPEPSAHFANELVAHLYDEEAALPMVTGWLERSFGAPMHEVMQQEHVRQTVQQTSLANVIKSCRRLAQIEWQELFEATSRRMASWPRIRPAFMRASILRRAIVTAMRWKKSPGGRSDRNRKSSTRR